MERRVLPEKMTMCAAVPRSRVRPRRPAKARVFSQRPRLVLLEPDGLTRWSIRTYLERWFEVLDASSARAAAALMGGAPVTALVVSEEVPSRAAALVERMARRNGAEVRTVRMVTGAGECSRSNGGAILLEKPFELAQLAHLLGVPEQEIAAR